LNQGAGYAGLAQQFGCAPDGVSFPDSSQVEEKTMPGESDGKISSIQFDQMHANNRASFSQLCGTRHLSRASH
jgi:hypothetical protein